MDWGCRLRCASTMFTRKRSSQNRYAFGILCQCNIDRVRVICSENHLHARETTVCSENRMLGKIFKRLHTAHCRGRLRIHEVSNFCLVDVSPFRPKDSIQVHMYMYMYLYGINGAAG